VLYELLTGRPPFRTTDALELIYAHLAAQPRPVVEIDSSIPLTVSRIVAKLLQKDPQLRYQTARGLTADLEQCQKQLASSGDIDEELVLGSEDASDRLRFPNKIYGRERECAELCAAFDRIAQGAMELVLLAGPAGIGKSSLPSVLQARLARTGGYLAEAKFDPDLRERPYAGFAAAFSVWVDQVLAERQERLAMWREEIRSSVGAIGQVLVGLAPNLAYVVGDFPPLPVVQAQEARERLALAVIRFVQTVARSAHPLVLLLDDLQWADVGSLFLLGALLRSGGPCALLIIGGYRDNEVGDEHPFSKLMQDVAGGATPVRRIELSPLRLEDTTAMLADALGRTHEDAEWLARRVGPKSQHNPLLVRRLMFHLWDRNLIRYEHGLGWVWDEQRLTEAEITDDAASMVAARIDALPPNARELVKLASLIGTVFELEVLVALAGADRLDVLQQLMSLVDQGLIAPCRDGFKFVHDRIREAAQSRLTHDERAAQHHRTAQLLLERTPVERRPAIAFQLAEHLCGALDRLGESERPQAIEILYMAGSAALDKGAPGTAAYYLGFARSLLSASDWKERLQLAYDIYRRSAEAAYQQGEFDVALQLLEVPERYELDPFRAAVLISQRITVYTLARPDDALELSLASLRKLGIRWPSNPSLLRVWIDILRTDWLLRGPLDRSTFSLERTADLAGLAPVVILRAGGGPITQHSNRLTCLAVAYALRTFRRHFALTSPSLALSAYAAFRIAVTWRLQGADRYARAASYWLDAAPHPVLDIRSRVNLEAFVHSWLKPRRKILEPLERSARDALEVGDLEYVMYARLHQIGYALLSGESLAQTGERIEALRKQESSMNLRVRYSEAHRILHSLLVNGNVNAIDWDAQRVAFEECVRGVPFSDVYVDPQWIATLCVFGEFERASFHIEKLRRRIFTIGMSGSRLADYLLFQGICAAVRAETVGSFLERRRLLYTLRSCLRQLRKWARHGPDFAHMAALLQAEVTCVRGYAPAAIRQYQDAAQQARKASYPNHAALCLERRARLLQSKRRDTEAAESLASAADLYEEWGARTKVLQLKRARGTLTCATRAVW
jgi:histidine kinase